MVNISWLILFGYGLKYLKIYGQYLDFTGIYKAIFHNYLIYIYYLDNLNYPFCPIPSNLETENLLNLF